MPSTNPSEVGSRNGLEDIQAGNLELPFIAGQPDRFMGYVQMQFIDSGSPSTSSMPFTNRVALNPGPRCLVNGETAAARGERGRRSSGVSPRTIHSSTLVSPYIAEHSDGASQQLMIPSSEVAQTLPSIQYTQPQQSFPRASIATISSLSGTSISSTATINPNQAATLNQRRFLGIIDQICTEAVRRRWRDEVESNLMQSLTTNRNSYISESQLVLRSNNRYSPYGNSDIPGARQTRNVAPPPTPTGVGAQQEVSIMEYIHRIANTVWQRARMEARNNSVVAGQVELEALNYMQTLYVLGSSVARPCMTAASEMILSGGEMRDAIAAAGRLCHLLGYREGSARCDQVGRGWASLT